VTRIALAVVAAPLVLVLAVLIFIVLLFVLAGHFVQALLMAAGVFVFHRGFIEYRNELTVRNLPTAKVNSAAVGLVELIGRGRGGSPTPAAVSGTLSAYWTVRIEQRHQGGKNSDEWQTVLQRESPAATLEIEDDTGRMLVWSRGAEFALDKTTWHSKDGPPSEGAARLLAEAGTTWPDRSSVHPMRIVETRIEEGGALYVLGTLSERAQVPASFSRPNQAAASSSAGAPAASGAPQTRLVKWAERAGEPVNANWYPPEIEPQRLLVWKGDQKRPFVIGASEQQALQTISSTMKWELAIGGILIGIVLLTYLLGR
jgi:hypothetical protein